MPVARSLAGVSLLSDDQADRLRDLVSTRGMVDGGRWIRALLADRAERIALAQRVSRQIERARRALGRETRDLDIEQSLAAAKDTADAPWASQIRCQRCGAPVIRVGTDGARHAMVFTHPDGRRCTIEGLGGAVQGARDRLKRGGLRLRPGSYRIKNSGSSLTRLSTATGPPSSPSSIHKELTGPPPRHSGSHASISTGRSDGSALRRSISSETLIRPILSKQTRPVAFPRPPAPCPPRPS